MTSFNKFVSALIVVVCIVAVQGNYPRCPKKFYCPNTTINETLSNEVVFRQVQRDLIIRFWESPIGAQKLPKLSSEFREAVLDHVHTDSPSLLYTLYAHISSLAGPLANANDYPNLCNLARFINASVGFELKKDGNASSDAILALVNNVFGSCRQLAYASLSAIGCKTLPSVPLTFIKCALKGTSVIYNIEGAIDLFGKHLPCNLKVLLLDMYESKHYIDNLIAVTFIAGLGDLQRKIHSLHPQESIIETVNFLIENKASKCCCDLRAARLETLCSFHNATSQANAIKVIETIYLAPECKK